jgi:hypothetical protein
MSGKASVLNNILDICEEKINDITTSIKLRIISNEYAEKIKDFFLCISSNNEYHLKIAVSRAYSMIVCKAGQNISPLTIIPYSLGVKYKE